MQVETLEIISVGETCTLWASPSSPPPLDINQDEGCVEGPRLIPPVLLPLPPSSAPYAYLMCAKMEDARGRRMDGRTDAQEIQEREGGKVGQQRRVATVPLQQSSSFCLALLLNC